MKIDEQEHMNHVNALIERACKLLKQGGISWRPMTNRKAPVNTAHDYSLGYTEIDKKRITLDILTPRRREPKSYNAILRVLAHEIAHIQKPPYRQRHRGKWITRMHFPAFYDQVNKNIKKFKKDKVLGQYFRK